jgi:molybdopterin molybdotransferase
MIKPEPLRDMLGREGLTPVSEAQTILLDHLTPVVLASETVPLAEGLDRITSEDIIAPENLPPCDRSTMDGFAVIAADTFGASQSLPAYLNVVGEVFMGDEPDGKVSRGSCYKIPTGGVMPKGADAVVMFEHTVPIDEKMIELVKGVGSGSNIIRQGDDIRQGQRALSAGRLLRPQDLGLLAGLGISTVAVYRKISVGIISTGDEIVDYTKLPAPGEIRNINTVTISSQAKRCGADVIDYGIVSDSEEEFYSTVARAVNETDLVLFSGGSSVGMRDLGEDAIKQLELPGVLVHGVALKPGKPVIIGLSGNTPIFGLPGHPVSALNCFEFFVKPAIQIISGLERNESFPEATVSARLMRNINSAAGRLDVIRVQLSCDVDDYQAHPILGKSGAISTLSRAHGYFIIAEDIQGLETGSLVKVYLYL